MKPALSFILLGCVSIMPTQAKSLYAYEDKDGSLIIADTAQSSSSYKKLGSHVMPASYSAPSSAATNMLTLPSSRTPKVLPSTFNAIIDSAARKFGVNASLIRAVIHAESNFNQFARSPVGAQGLMQLMPATARRFGVTNSFDPDQNINAGTQYLSWLLKRFNGNEQLAIAGYNAGEGNIDKYRGIPPFKETRNYVVRVMGLYKNAPYLSQVSATIQNTVATLAPAITAASSEMIRLSDDSFGDAYAQ